MRALPATLQIIGWIVSGLALVGAGYQLLAGACVGRFRGPPAPPAEHPPVTILKPLHGAEPGLAAALESFVGQAYAGEVQIVLGVQDEADPAVQVVEALRARHPDRAIVLVSSPGARGANRKVSNLINMLGAARHNLLVMADSDIAVTPDYLGRVVAALGEPDVGEPDKDEPGVGVVTCPYHGRAAAGFWSRLTALGISHQFLPSVAVGVTLRMASPCMGSTIALRRETLARIGGFEAFADELADDYALGAAVRGLGLRSVVAPVLVAHDCAETSLRGLIAHERRWAITIRRLDPAGFFGSAVTHALPLGLLGVLLTGAAAPALAALAAAVACRFWSMARVDALIGAEDGGWRLAPVRDILSFAIFLSAFFGRAVEWRGARFSVDPQRGLRRL
jgi:ceramide glucosyltransferase